MRLFVAVTADLVTMFLIFMLAYAMRMYELAWAAVPVGIVSGWAGLDVAETIYKNWNHK